MNAEKIYEKAEKRLTISGKCGTIFKQSAQTASHLRSFPGHGFKKNGCGLLLCKNCIQYLRNLLDSNLDSLSHMASRVEIIVISRGKFHALQIIRKSLLCKLSQILLHRTGIQSIRGMSHYFPKFMLPGKLQKLCHIRRINSLGISPSWISCKKRECIPAVFHHLPPHGSVSFRRRCMISYI